VYILLFNSCGKICCKTSAQTAAGVTFCVHSVYVCMFPVHHAAAKLHSNMTLLILLYAVLTAAVSQKWLSMESVQWERKRSMEERICRTAKS